MGRYCVLVGALFSGGLVRAILLVLTSQDRGSLNRRHALAASIVWGTTMTSYPPRVLVAGCGRSNAEPGFFDSVHQLFAARVARDLA